MFEKVTQLYPFITNAYVEDLRLPNVRGKIFFGQNSDEHGLELWKSDGTAEGTELVCDIVPGWRSSVPHSFFPFNQHMYFVANDSAHGAELWKSDGTAAGTVLVADLNPGAEGLIYSNFTVCEDRLFFFASYGLRGISELYISDGTGGGTQLLRSFNWGPPISSLITTCLNDKIYFLGKDSLHGTELWVTDGTPGGTRIFHEFTPGVEGTYIYGLRAVDQKLFIAINPDWSSEHQLWVVEPSSSPTLLANIAPSELSSLTSLTRVGGTLYFQVSVESGTRELWKSDGTAIGTVPVKQFHPRNPSYALERLTDMDGMLFFVATDSISGTEIWRSDGTPEGTVLVKDIATGVDRDGSVASSYPTYLTPGRGVLYFVATDGIGPLRLWSTAGTAFSTEPVEGFPVSGFPNHLTNIEGRFYFTVFEWNGSMSYLWKMTSPWNSTIVRDGFTLLQNYPNPFNLGTRIQYSILRSSRVRISVYNVLGEAVAQLIDETQFPGDYGIDFSGTNLPTGVYFYALSVQDRTRIGKMILIR